MRHRANSSKIKYEHRMIPGLREFLEKIENWQEIKTIIPGKIKSVKTAFSNLIFVCQYETATGFKCFAKSKRSIQEVFIVTNNKKALIARLEKLCKNNNYS